MFGLGTTSGMEIPEADPQISDDSSVPSAIGQGTNNYTTSQLARYVTTIANKGTLFDLTLLNKTTDVKGNVIEESQPKSIILCQIFLRAHGMLYTKECVM